MKRIWIACLAVAVTASLSLAAGMSPAESINDKCPVSGEKVDAKATKEIKIGFCCGNCKGKFDKDPVACLSKQKELPGDKCPLSGKAVADASSTVVVAFCCDDCKGKFDKEPAKFIGKVKAREKK